MQPAYKAYTAICASQLVFGVFLLWMGFTCSLHYLRLHRHPLVDAADDVARCAHTIAVSANNNTTAPEYVVARGTLKLEAAYFLACAGASCIAMLFINSHTVDDSAPDQEGLSLITDGAFWVFLLMHTVAVTALGTGVLAVGERFLLRVAGRCGSLGGACAVPNTSALLAAALLGWVWESWAAFGAICTQDASVIWLLQRGVDLTLVMGHRCNQADQPDVIWRCRVFYAASSSLLMQGAILTAPW